MKAAPLALVLLAVPALAGSPPAGQQVRWEGSLESALKSARREQRPLMVDFWAEWCGWCRRLDHTTYRDAQVVRLTSEFVAVKVNTEGTAREMAFAARYNVGSLPTVVFLSPEGRLLLRVDGYQGPGTFPQTLEQARAEALRVMGWEQALRKNADDPAALSGLGLYLFEHEFYEDSRELLARAVRGDKDQPARQRKYVRLLVAAMSLHEHRYSESESMLHDALEIQPADPLDAKLLFHLARTYQGTGRTAEARATLRRLIETTPSGPLSEKARETLLALER